MQPVVGPATAPHLSRFAMRSILCLSSAALVTAAFPLAAQEESAPPAETPAEGSEGGGTIVVTAPRLRGQVITEQEPIAVYDEEDIKTFGAGSVADLVAAVSAQTGSARGRGGGQPVFLVNGIRVASFREFRSYPPEAVARVEVLPEEVAQRFGFAPDRRVINFILKEDFSSREVEFEYAQPGGGGYSANEQEFTLLRIIDGARINANLEFEDTTLLTEAERGVRQSASSVPTLGGASDPAAFRSLVADSSSIEATANWAKAFLESGSSLSLNATFARADARSLSGLDTVLLGGADGATALRILAGDPLERRSRSDSYAGAATYTRPIGDFQLTATADATFTNSVSEIDRRADSSALVAAAASGMLALDAPLPALPDPGFDTASSDTYRLDTKATLRGRAFDLPAGEVAVTLDGGFVRNGIESEDTRGALPVQLSRSRFEGGVNLVVPVTSRRYDVADAIGSFTLNGSAGLDHLSDFGTLSDYTIGLNWEPFDNLDLQATFIAADAAPSLTQLGGPRLVTLNVPVFDFVTGESVLAGIITGGNPDLIAESQRDWKFSANWELPFWENTRLRGEYVRNRSDDVTAAFPVLTPAIEAAFPLRVDRAADGTLLSIDRRPVTFAETRANRAVIALTTRGEIGDAEERESGRGRGGPSFMIGGGNDGVGRYFVNLQHTIELENTVLVAPGGPLLDQLAGQALGEAGFARNASSLEAGLFWNGYGVRLSGDYIGEASILGAGGPEGDLFLGELATFDLRLFLDLGEVLDAEEGLFEGLRLSLSADNIFDARRRITDGNGEVPLAFQPFLVDPVGRFLGIELRKLF